MGNAIKGEVSFEAGGRTYVLVYSIDALCALEERLDISVTEIGQAMGKTMRLGFLRALFWAGLRERQPEVTEKAAGELIPLIGADALAPLLTEAFAKAFPTPEGGAPQADPPEAAAP